MTTLQVRWDMKMGEDDWQLFEQLWKYLKRQNLSTFTSDTLRDAGITAKFADPSKAQGAFIAKLKVAGLAIDTQKRVPSKVEANHGHKIGVYRVRGLEDSWTMAQKQEIM